MQFISWKPWDSTDSPKQLFSTFFLHLNQCTWRPAHRPSGEKNSSIHFPTLFCVFSFVLGFFFPSFMPVVWRYNKKFPRERRVLHCCWGSLNNTCNKLGNHTGSKWGSALQKRPSQHLQVQRKGEKKLLYSTCCWNIHIYCKIEHFSATMNTWQWALMPSPHTLQHW